MERGEAYMDNLQLDKIKGIALLVSGWLFAFMGFLATLNIQFRWLTEASISSFTALFVASLSLLVNVYAIWKNTFVSKKAQKQNKILHEQKLK